MYLPGAVSLWVAAAALVVSTIFYYRALRGRAEALAWARQLYALATFAIVLASVVLLFLILKHDFRLHYVFSYSDRSLPLGYLVSTFWAGQEGSFLLWLFWGMLMGLPLIRYARHYENTTMLAYNLTLLSLLAILLRQSPFRFLEGLPPGQVPFDGQGLNPLLQNPWMTIHPPIMFLGYAATAVPFAFAVAALWERRYDEWVRASLPWALVSVVTLGCAILLGGYWAYITLGWGGYWGWDPVENSSLVPWISSAALVHGMILQKARGRFRKLNFSLAILSFVLVLYATFLTRSGILADFSVHSFVDLGITGWLIFNLLFFLLVGFGLLVLRWREVPTQAGDEPFFSRTVFFVLAIAALLGTAAMVLLGTSSPLITRLAAQPAQVGPAFYNRVTLPIGIVLAALLGVVPYLHWRGTHREFRARIAATAVLAAVATGAAILFGAHGVLYLLFFAASAFAFASNLFKTVEEVRDKRLRAAGGYLAHVGLGLMLAGIITSSAYDRTAKVVLPLNQERIALGYTLTFKGIERPTPSARQAMLVEVRDPDGSTYVARPRMFRNEKSNQLVANPDVKVRLTHDVYVSPIEFDPGDQTGGGDSVQLAKGQSVERGGLTLTFEGFDMTGAHESGESIQIGARFSVASGGHAATVTPVLAQTPNGLVADPVTLPGAANASVRLLGIDATSGKVMLGLDGLGSQVAARASLGKGQRLEYGGVTLTFRDFDMSEFDPDAGIINIGAVFEVARAGGAAGETITSFVRSAQGGQEFEDAGIPGLPTATLRLGAMNANDGIIEVQIRDTAAAAPVGEPMRFSIDFTVKPMIGMLWLGLVVLLLGGLLATARRTEEFRTAAPGPAAPAA